MGCCIFGGDRKLYGFCRCPIRACSFDCRRSRYSCSLFGRRDESTDFHGWFGARQGWRTRISSVIVTQSLETDISLTDRYFELLRCNVRQRRQSLNSTAKTETRASKPLGTGASLLRVASLTKSYATPQGRIVILKAVNLALDVGSSLALMGESGSGKSTLLNLIAGLDDADEGEIFLDAVDITALSDFGRAAFRRETLGVVFQQFNLIPSLTVGTMSPFRRVLPIVSIRRGKRN